MYFIDQRIQVIANQLQLLRFRDKMDLPDWQCKFGQYFRPQEADASELPWEDFNCYSMRWYSNYVGTEKFEGAFQGQITDFKGILGAHYWFRRKITIPERFAGHNVWMKIRTQIEEWDDGKNPQFLIFVNGEVRQGADMNHREFLLVEHAKGGEELTLDIQAYTGTLHLEFNFLTELYWLDEDIDRLYYDIQVPLWAFPRMDKDDKVRLDLQTVLNNTINLLDMRVPYSDAFQESVKKALDYIGVELYEKMAGYEDVIATCIGHTHIDVAWWWTVAQTREKVVRSFATVLKLMEEYPSYKVVAAIRQKKPASILVLGTSDGMTDRIIERLGLPPLQEDSLRRIHIEDITTPEERAIAREQRDHLGKHVIPAPALQLKRSFAGYFMDPLRFFRGKDQGAAAERTVVRPTYSYMGEYFIDEKAINDIITCTAKTMPSIGRVVYIVQEASPEAYELAVSIKIRRGYPVWEAAQAFQEKLSRVVEEMTAFNVAKIDVEVRGIS